jgi:hypothetical protein
VSLDIVPILHIPSVEEYNRIHPYIKSHPNYPDILPHHPISNSLKNIIQSTQQNILTYPHNLYQNKLYRIHNLKKSASIVSIKYLSINIDNNISNKSIIIHVICNNNIN